jgi:toxin ParE1/3/4
MVAKHFYSPRAEQDLNEIAEYILIDNLDAAVRFVDAVEETCANLADMPEVGRIFQCANKSLAGMRMMRVDKPYIAYLVFYRQAGKRVEIIRIFHGAQDYPILFG